MASVRLPLQMWKCKQMNSNTQDISLSDNNHAQTMYRSPLKNYLLVHCKHCEFMDTCGEQKMLACVLCALVSQRDFVWRAKNERGY